MRVTMIAAVALIPIMVACCSEMPKTGEELLLVCHEYEKTKAGQVTENRDRQMAGFSTCVGFIVGTEVGSLNAGCAPEDRPPEQEIEVVIKYLKENLSLLHRPASLLVEEALREAWPCN